MTLSRSFESHSQRIEWVYKDFQPCPSKALSSLQIAQKYTSTERKELSSSVDESIQTLVKQSRNAKVLEYMDNIDEIWDRVVLKKNTHIQGGVRHQPSIVTI